MFLSRRTFRHRPGRRLISSAHQTFSKDDVVLLRSLQSSERTYLSKPLHPDGTIETHRGSIRHADIISRTVRAIVCTPKGVKFRATFPTMEEYIVGVRRLVTPVYPTDAATIVSLLDIHTSPTLPVHVLEAGTGHGSLTLHLCRAITSPSRGTVHTLDVSSRHSTHARSVLANFRRGVYAECAQFYVSDPATWCAERKSDGEFLTHAVLDLPGPQRFLADVAGALAVDGVLGLWCPSVSQIMVAIKKIRSARLPLAVDRIVEFPGGAGVGAGLRRWDVRPAVIRIKAREEAGDEGETPAEAVKEGDDEEQQEEEEEEEEEEPFVCRPAVGDRIVGGGFFAMFRKKGTE